MKRKSSARGAVEVSQSLLIDIVTQTVRTEGAKPSTSQHNTQWDVPGAIHVMPKMQDTPTPTYLVSVASILSLAMDDISTCRRSSDMLKDAIQVVDKEETEHDTKYSPEEDDDWVSNCAFTQRIKNAFFSVQGNQNIEVGVHNRRLLVCRGSMQPIH